MGKILCPDGKERTVEEVLNSNFYPKPILKALLQGRDRPKKKNRDRQRFGVTRLVSSCLRKSYYDLVEDVPITLEQLWIFNRGHAIHNYIQEHLEKDEQEIFITKKFHYFDVIGFVDALHDNILFEYKTTANIPSEPKKEHALQSQAYFSMLPPEVQEKVEKIQVVYFSLSKIKIYDVPKRDILPYLEARGTLLANALTENKPPQREEGWLCNYCDFTKMCRPKLLFPNDPEHKTTSETKQISL